MPLDINSEKTEKKSWVVVSSESSQQIYSPLASWMILFLADATPDFLFLNN